MLVAKNIIKKFDSLEVLKGVNLEIKESEIIAIVGDSGSGKSTLLHILGTLDSCDEGSISLNDRDYSSFSGKQLNAFRNNEIGFVFQFHNLLPEFTALENVCLPGFIGNKPQKEVTERAKHLLGILGLEHKIHHKPSQMSGGEQQRAAVARALINSPKIIFADEPSGNLDTKNAKELHELFFRLKDELKTTFVIVTHNPDLANMATRKLLMKDGFLLEN